jgi:hypothetical protein
MNLQTDINTILTAAAIVLGFAGLFTLAIAAMFDDMEF